ncbi:hypothetical protein Ssi02_76600 [Sinosporangium siamense]|uniref:Uncharacterized protein n=1 Tax=Sinosporangium siamense TaxID=1367973 RepID=A0A919VGT6_9ACTN|nr:hypothetical protein Ssi02_76600 [Sinosporangium siamense]
MNPALIESPSAAMTAGTGSAALAAPAGAADVAASTVAADAVETDAVETDAVEIDAVETDAAETSAAAASAAASSLGVTALAADATDSRGRRIETSGSSGSDPKVEILRRAAYGSLASPAFREPNDYHCLTCGDWGRLELQ